MPVLQLTVTVELDGQPLSDLSLVRRLVVDNALPFLVRQPSSGAPATIPAVSSSGILTLAALLVRASDQPISLAPPAALVLNPGGLLLLFDAATSPAGITLLQNSGSPSTVQGLAAGNAV